jgi:hypothetical protein
MIQRQKILAPKMLADTLARRRRHNTYNFRSRRLDESRPKRSSKPTCARTRGFRLGRGLSGLYGPPLYCKRKVQMVIWSAPVYPAFL